MNLSHLSHYPISLKSTPVNDPCNRNFNKAYISIIKKTEVSHLGFHKYQNSEQEQIFYFIAGF